MKMEDAALISKALSDANRLKVIESLTHGEKCACELLEKLNVSQPTLSHHMKILEDCGLVKTRKQGKWTHYRINCLRFRKYNEFIASLTCDEKAEEEKKDDGCCCCCGN